MGRDRAALGRRIRGLLVAAVVALALEASPPAARPALAAPDPLRTETSATYTLDPAAGRVHVAIDITETDLKPNTPGIVFYYTEFGFALQPEATSVRVSGGNADRVTTRKRDGYVEATVHLGNAMFYREQTTFTIRYDLVGGKPRSDSPTRVGAAFSVFGVWAWGDPGLGSVEVRIPKGFDTSFDGDDLRITGSPATGQVLRASPADPSTFFTIVTAEDADAYAQTRVSLDGGVEIVVRSWPEDARWQSAVSETLRDAMPELRSLIGLPWPVEHDLDVRERYTPALEGYAGLYLTDEQRIDVSEDLDPVTIVHEASHAWFNDSLFADRWIYEGLAEEYAWRAMTEVGLDAEALPDEPSLLDPGRQALIAWTFPRVIRDQDTDDQERYGYNASFWVMHAIVEAVGVRQMAVVFAAAAENRTAYPGVGQPETVASADDWRRFLDLVEQPDRPDPAGLDAAIRAYVTTTVEAQQLVRRDQARDSYRALLDAGDGWLPPWSVRGPMGEWDFVLATSGMAEATAVLDRRDQVEAAATALGLTPDGALRSAYEGAKDSLADASALARRQLDALAAIAAARARVEATPDLFAQIGLLGETPAVAYAAARSAFEAGDLDAALASARTAAVVVDGAAAVGQERVLVAAVSLGAALLLLVLVAVLVRRRRRRRRELALALASGPAATEAYGTLAATPAPEDVEGGPASSG